MSDLNGLRRLYQLTAPYYQESVVPVFGPLVSDLAVWIIRCAAARFDYTLYDPFDNDPSDDFNERGAISHLASLTALDLGTGTGLLAHAMTPYVKQIVGLDISTDMLRLMGRSTGTTSQTYQLHPLQADLHTLPFRRNSIHLAVSSFGLNASTPKPAFKAIIQVLKRGEGILAFQEWGAEDDCSRIVDEVLNEYTSDSDDVDDDDSTDTILDTFYAAPKLWYNQLQDTDDYYTLLKSLGFELVWAKEAAFTTVQFSSIAPFIRYKFAWPGRRDRLEVMPLDKRTAFETDLHQRLTPYLNRDGSFSWSPMLFRVFAQL